jgi:hypothetical protein
MSTAAHTPRILDIMWCDDRIAYLARHHYRPLTRVRRQAHPTGQSVLACSIYELNCGCDFNLDAKSPMTESCAQECDQAAKLSKIQAACIAVLQAPIESHKTSKAFVHRPSVTGQIILKKCCRKRLAILSVQVGT